MADTAEQTEIKEATKTLRHRERQVLKKHGFGNYHSYWDADDYCLLAEYKPLVMNIPAKNKEIIISAKFGYSDPKGRLVVHATQIVELQFATKDHIEALLMAHEIFEGSILGDMHSDGIKDMEQYCVKMDQIIAETGHELREKKIKAPFSKIWQEMGGTAIPSTDRLAKRILYFKEIAARYAADKDRWRPEMKRLYLIK